MIEAGDSKDVHAILSIHLQYSEGACFQQSGPPLFLEKDRAHYVGSIQLDFGVLTL